MLCSNALNYPAGRLCADAEMQDPTESCTHRGTQGVRELLKERERLPEPGLVLSNERSNEAKVIPHKSSNATD